MQALSLSRRAPPFYRGGDFCVSSTFPALRESRVKRREEPSIELEQFKRILDVSERTTDSRHLRGSGANQFVAQLVRIHRVSEELFPGPVSMEYVSDPDDASVEYVVFDVIADGEFKQYREREYQWHDEVERIIPSVSSEIRLCVHPKP